MTYSIGLSPSSSFWTRPMLGAVGTSVGGSMLFILVPLLVEGLRTGATQFTAREAGLVASSGTFGMFLGAIAALLLVSVGQRQAAMGGALALLAGNLGCIAASSVTLLALCCLLAGFGGGLMLGVGHAAMSRSAAAERAYALFLVTQTLLASLLIFVLSKLGLTGHAPAFIASTVVLLLTLPSVFWLPEKMADDGNRSAKRPPFPISSRFAALIVLTFALWGTVLLGMWSFVETVASANGLDQAAFSRALSIALIGGLICAMTIVVIGTRLGRILPLLVLGAPYFLALIMFATPLSAIAFLIAAFLFQFGTQAASYVFGSCVEIEELGRPGILYLLGLKGGFALGPVVGALIIESAGMPGLLKFSAIGGVISFALFTWIIVLAVQARQMRLSPASPGA